MNETLDAPVVLDIPKMFIFSVLCSLWRFQVASRKNTNLKSRQTAIFNCFSRICKLTFKGTYLNQDILDRQEPVQ
jgi:hypothetical protein